MSALKLDIEKFDGRINFDLWQVQVKDVLIQHGLHNALKGKPTPVSSEDSKQAGSSMSNVLANMLGISSAKELWEKLEELYQAKGISNRLLLKKQFHTLRMDEATKISDHLSTLNGIVSELEAIGVNVDDEDKALGLIFSLPPCYNYIKSILMYGKETLNFYEVVSKLISEERRLKSEGHLLQDPAMVAREMSQRKNKNLRKNVKCWECGKIGHVRRFCPGGAGSAKGSENDAGAVTLATGDDEIF